MVGNTPEEIIANIRILLDSAKKRNEMAVSAQQFVQEKYRTKILETLY